MSKENKSIPRHVGIIMDGNRRWARERNLPTIEGHRRGYGKMKIISEYFFNLGVEVVTVFAFSTENWSRSREEVNYLMKLINKALTDDFEEFNKKNIRLMISGRIDELPGDLPEICSDAIVKTKDNNRGTLNICLNYGGRAEIIDAIKRIINKGLEASVLNEEIFKKYLYNGYLGDPDIIIRTSGEKRLSGFQLWESAYSELHFIKKYWPDFEKTDVKAVVDEYSSRKRRFGAK